jgi:hypothetical protein
MSPPAVARCKTCRYWRAAVTGKAATWTDWDGRRSYVIEHSQCRHSAPVAIVSSSMRKLAEAKWPETNATDWCGAHMPAVDPGKAPPAEPGPTSARKEP